MSEIAAYSRVSTKQQREEGSHEQQCKRIQQWADRNGYDEIEWFEDIAVSGQADDRDDYEALMESYGDYDAVVVRELSRFGRDPVTIMQETEKIIESETDFISITDQFDTSSAMG